VSAVTPPGRPRSVLICHRGADFDREGLARWLGSFSTVTGIVELDEPVSRTAQRIRREIKRSGLLGLADVLAFQALYRLGSARRDRSWEASAVERLRHRFADVPECANVLRARSVNSPECVEFIRDCQPDFMLARCKTLLKPSVFTLAPGGTYVLHPGICPEYRNAHGCFWALSAGDLSRVGLTLLRIDAGVDTGPVYGHFTYPFDEREESHIVIQLRVLLENLDAIRDTMLKAVGGAAEPLDLRGRKSAVWGQPRMTAYARWKLRARREAYADSKPLVP
jgi:folate-dependent phosphoribosylglycinamide formyltransferase PurN